MQPNATVNGSNAEIYVLNLATKVAKRLTNSGAADYTPTWSPDGTKLASPAAGRGSSRSIP